MLRTILHAALLAPCFQVYAGDVMLNDLKCDYRVTPLAVERQDPLLSWRLEAEHQGAAQQAWQIQAASSLTELKSADLWDSGWVEEPRSTGIAYAGASLRSHQRAHWRVRIKDEQGAVSPWSAPTWFETGLLQESDWHDAQWISCTRERDSQLAPRELMGPWIGPDEQAEEPLEYQTVFDLPEKHVVYAGTWWGTSTPTPVTCTVNEDGAKYTFRHNAPNYTDFAFNLHPGENTVSLQLPKAPADCAITFGMRIVFADGTEQLVQSSPQWTVADRPAREICPYVAETCRANSDMECGGKRAHATPERIAGGSERHTALKAASPSGSARLAASLRDSAAALQNCGDRSACSTGSGEATVYSHAPLPATWYKTDFTTDRPIESARLVICGLGYHEPTLNGTKVGDHVLDPGQTDYEELALYQVFDVTELVQDGSNTLAVLLGDGWYNQDRGFCLPTLAYGKPGLRALLRLRYADGSTRTVVTDDGWRWRASGTLRSNIYLGDRMDFRKEHDEWKRPGFSDAWQPAQTVPPLSPRLTAQDFPPIRKIRDLTPVKQWQVGDQTWVFDLGQNISGWVRLRIQEPEGSTIRVRCTEMQDPESGHLLNVPKSFWWCHGAPQHHEIISDGRPHTWEPRFSYHGFRYVEVSGLTRPPAAHDVVGVVVHTDVPVAATFQSADPLLNRIFQMGVQTHLNNMHSILEDCPHREKCMWGGDLHSSWALGLYGLDSTTFYRQLVNLYYTPPFAPNGVPGNVGVGKRISRHFTDFSWAVSPLFLTWRLYQVDGELETARVHYAQMHKFLKHFEKNAPGLIPAEAAHADHAPPGGVDRAPQDKHLIAAMNFYAATRRFAELAAALDKPEDAAWAIDLAARIRTAIYDRSYDAEAHSFGNGTHDSLALAFGIPAPEERAAVADSLASVYRNNGKQFDGGFMSYHIYPQLAEHGEVDLALAMLRNPDYPGLAWSIQNFDATTIWETFTLDLEKQLDRSLDHHAMNHPSAWLLTHLAGIQTHPDEPGSRRILLQPCIPTDLAWVEASVQTLYGAVKSSWKQENGTLTWSVTIPPNASAEIRLPDANKQRFERPAGTHTFTWDRMP